jgi:ribosomal protein L11 methyltransferase
MKYGGKFDLVVQWLSNDGITHYNAGQSNKRQDASRLSGRDSTLTKGTGTEFHKTAGNTQPAGSPLGSVPSPAGKPGRQWICIDIGCNADGADDLAAIVAERFAVGVEITEDGIRFYLPCEMAASRTWESELRQLLDAFRAIHGETLPLQVTNHLVIDEGWADRWKEYFKPLRVGRRFIICPTWEEPEPRPGDLVIRIDPGQAFGTGHHETTRLCLEWLDDCDPLLAQHHRVSAPHSRRPAYLDVGTGTGILAMGAALLGYSEVVAIDNDPEAVRVAAENVTINRLDARIRLSTSSVDQVQGCFDVVMANIQALPLIDLAPALVSKLSSTGRLVLSGILLEQRELVVTAYDRHGLHLASERSAGEWCLLEFSVSID